MKKLVIFILILSNAYAIRAAEPVSIKGLLVEMTDRTEKARFPSPAFTTRQFSSYDRLTVEEGKPGWFANWDRSQFLAVERDNGRREFVMMDSEGPGAVVRFWMTFAGENAGQGTLRIYVDDMKVPVIEGKAFDVLSGDVVSGAPLAASVSELSPYDQRGHNLYFPIPYARRCKVTYESEGVWEDEPGGKRGECVYYNINYRTYEPGTAVVSYSKAEMARNKSLIARTLKQLREMDRGLKGVRLQSVPLDAELAAGQSKSIDMTGTKAVRRIGMRIEADDIPQALRSVVVEIAFDGEKTVWIPAGDFFGTGPRRLYTNTWYTDVSQDGTMNAWWVMPFENECRITLINRSSETVHIRDAAVEFSAWKWDDRSMYFGSSWHQYNAIHTGGLKDASGENEGLCDLNFVTLSGKGVYIGDGVALYNTTYAWWGEGDEKVYVDGEAFPSHIGTGTEDYYGYAWCRPEAFTDHPFIAQPCGEGSYSPGYTANIRLRALDGIPFQESLRFDMELWHWAKGGIDYACSTFWYAMPGSTSNIAPDLEGVRRKVATRRSDIMPERTELSVEGEAMQHLWRDAGHFEYRFAHPEELSGGMQLFWTGAAEKQRLTVQFDNAFEFSGPVSALCCMEPGGYTVAIYLNGKPLGSVDFDAPQFEVKRVELGEGQLQKGPNRLEFEITGVPATGDRGNMGIDKLIFGL